MVVFRADGLSVGNGLGNDVGAIEGLPLGSTVGDDVVDITTVI